ncbi:Sulfite exporter TauE/SafE [Serratia rubidaea]|uniref:sulfite exporter TauE/SafE family protein n=1 Tax=Serratia rubidaea TaxID=61652 RepID=UPI0006C74A35|nr:sulfite exporter TauE/SafE family protein [Serratia rubidaea]MBS0975517.1 sulfite exporter TauE/SafE family protein [Serratia rubidaea]QPR63830.1 sulfite exporter TauE/SafE family protein [Serratia rubidaea]WBF46609.1 sulfite exporter TauE/SafE family protein [Serratia rubidaea]CAI1050639.1 Sulfite exporter TauE/SafE [Serratia rubidaea]CAI1816189.1 Sulfite exporter TauE/SafE [Serratia rubidaea]
MTDFDSATLLLSGAVFLLAGLVKGVTGMGLPTVAMGLLGALISPVAAAGMLLLPSLVTNIFQLAGGGNTAALLRRLWPMLLMVTLATLCTSGWIAAGNSSRTQLALGVALIIYGLWTLSGRIYAVSARGEKYFSPVVGLATGMLTGGTGVFVMPAVPWLQALGLEKDELVQALGISFTCSTLALAAGLWWHGAFQAGSLGASTLAVLPALVGLFAGQKLRRVISPLLFRRCFLLCLIVLGVEMTLRAL